MAKTGGQAARLLHLMELLLEETDGENMLTLNALAERMERLGYATTEKTFRSDMTELIDYCDTYARRDGSIVGDSPAVIVDRRFKEHRYGASDTMRHLSLTELKLLIDAVLSAKFITSAQALKLIGRLERLTSVKLRARLHRQTVLSGRTRTAQDSVIHTADVLNEAIANDRKVLFRYFNWNRDAEKSYRHRGAFYRVSPWALTWDDGKYYLIADDNDSADRGVRNYRVDKMEDIRISEEPREFSEHFDGLDQAAYTNTLFGMYGGATTKITMECADDLANAVYDQFGKDRFHYPVRKGWFSITTDVQLSPNFYGWIIGVGCWNRAEPGIRITGPAEAVEGMRKYMETIGKM